MSLCPAKKIAQGTTHVLTQINEEIEDLFLGMGYKIVDGPEVEQDSYNFRKDEFTEGSSCPRYAGYFLHQRRTVAAHAYIAGTSTHDGEA